ncbi:MAG: SurA N-terminal domain-containing protein [Gammaproteobacteria bacterium]
MLQAINDRIKGWLGIVIVVLIGLPFALWGIQSYLDDAGPRYAAKVNNIEISANEFERSVSMQRQSMLRQYGGQLPIEEKALRERTLTQLINQRLLESVTFENGYRISDSVLSAKIKQLFTVDGVFDRSRFEASTRSLGMSVPMYEQTLRNELRLQQMQTAIANSSFVTKEEVHKLAALNEQTRDITVLTFDTEHFSTAGKPAEEEIKQYYEANMQRFMVAEKIKVDYIEITSAALSENLEVDEDKIKKMYEEYVDSISGREERKARHILITATEDKKSASSIAAKEKIKSLKLELEQGADFAELAKKYSQDSGSAVEGGDLGWVALGEMVKPFEQVLFDMNLPDKDKDSVSEIVETQFGYHLIKLDDVRSEAIEPFETKRDGYEEEFKADGVASMFYDLSERLASTTYENPDNLDTAAEELGLKIISSDYFTRNEGKGITENKKLRNIAFSALVLEQGSNSDIIEIGPSHAVVLRLNEHIPATAIPLAQVSSKIENILTVQNGLKQTKIAALGVKSKVESTIAAGESLESLKADGISIDVISSLGRKDNAKVSDPSILHNAFEIAPKQNETPSVKEIDLISGDVALIVLTAVNIPDNIAQDKLDQVKNGALRDNAIRDFSSVLLAIKEGADINKNTRLIEK